MEMVLQRLDQDRALRGLTRETLADALASYVRTIRSKDSHFDLFLAGWPMMMSDLELEGLRLFKTPTLRDVALRGPYMHDGSLLTLEEVVDFYDRGGNQNPYLDERIAPLHLSPEEKKALLAFLRSGLSGSIVEGTPQKSTR